MILTDDQKRDLQNGRLELSPPASWAAIQQAMDVMGIDANDVWLTGDHGDRCLVIVSVERDGRGI